MSIFWYMNKISLVIKDVRQLTQKPTHRKTNSPSCDQLTQIDWSTHQSCWSTHSSFGTTHPSFNNWENAWKTYFSFRYTFLIIKAMLWCHLVTKKKRFFKILLNILRSTGRCAYVPLLLGVIISLISRNSKKHLYLCSYILWISVPIEWENVIFCLIMWKQIVQKFRWVI